MSADLDLSNVPFTRDNAFIVYGFESNGSEDPAEIAQAALENGKLLKCPVLAQDASMAVALFSERYPDLVPSGVVSLSQLQEEQASLEEFFIDQARQSLGRQ